MPNGTGTTQRLDGSSALLRSGDGLEAKQILVGPGQSLLNGTMRSLMLHDARARRRLAGFLRE